MILEYGDTGGEVSRLQRHLNANQYRHQRVKLVVDGIFGPLTAASVQGTKFWMGYPKGELSPQAGEKFMSFLTDETRLPDSYRARRHERLEAVANQPVPGNLRERALAIIKGEIGTHESPNHSNNIKYNEWWGWGPVAYCVIGISWAWIKAGSKAFERGSRWANTDAMLADAREGRNGLHLTDEPLAGCPGVIDFEGHSDPDHAITFVRELPGGLCETIEFNSTKNGVEGVWRQTRPLRNCWFFEVEQ